MYSIAPDLFGCYTSYTKQYCNAHRGRFGWDVSGLSNADELHSKMKKVMIRRLKADVLDELPSKQRSLVPIVITNKTKRKQCEALMKELRETRQSISDLVGDEASGAHFEARKLLMEAYQSSGIAKAAAVSEYVVEWLRGSGTQKVLIFAHHKGVLDTIEVAVAKELKGAGHIRIDGSISSQDRAIRVNKFQTCSKIRVAILSMTAAGVGLTLTAASSVMFAELHWTPGVLAQAEDRCHRIGQRNSVNVFYLVCEGTLLAKSVHFITRHNRNVSNIFTHPLLLNLDENLSVVSTFEESKIVVNHGSISLTFDLFCFFQDMQLWHMLGRKTNNLGRVVDGERNAGMGAKKSLQNGSGVALSVQNELQTFFAEAKIQDEKKSKVLVKGTIMSFFAKQKQKVPHSKKLSSTNTCTESEKNIPLAQKPLTSFGRCPKGNIEMVEWNCEACTFRNKQHRSFSNKMACEMCGTQYQEVIEIDDEETSSRRATPTSLQKGDYGDSGANKQLSKFSTIRKRTRQSLSTSRPEAMTIDCTEESSVKITPRKLDTALENPFVLSNLQVKTNPRKKQKSCEGKDESNISSVCSILKEGSPTREVATVLSFSVSRNSGRITIHFSDTGESTLTNFKVEQIVTAETADRLMEARLSRNHNAMTSIKLFYNEIAIRKGK